MSACWNGELGAWRRCRSGCACRLRCRARAADIKRSCDWTRAFLASLYHLWPPFSAHSSGPRTAEELEFGSGALSSPDGAQPRCPWPVSLESRGRRGAPRRCPSAAAAASSRKTARRSLGCRPARPHAAPMAAAVASRLRSSGRSPVHWLRKYAAEAYFFLCRLTVVAVCRRLSPPLRAPRPGRPHSSQMPSTVPPPCVNNRQRSDSIHFAIFGHSVAVGRPGEGSQAAAWGCGES